MTKTTKLIKALHTRGATDSPPLHTDLKGSTQKMRIGKKKVRANNGKKD